MKTVLVFVTVLVSLTILSFASENAAIRTDNEWERSHPHCTKEVDKIRYHQDDHSKDNNYTCAAESHSHRDLERLRILMQVLQEPDYFSAATGSFLTASQWTSTFLATLLIDYSQVTNDPQYFPHFVAFFNNQSVLELAFQGNDDKLWVCLTYLRGAAYASTHDSQWVQPFLDRAKLFYTLASQGWNNKTCGGGMIWGPFSSYKNAVTNELWVTASVGMYEAFGDQGMLETALQAWTWFNKSGLRNAEGLINDGLDDNCT